MSSAAQIAYLQKRPWLGGALRGFAELICNALSIIDVGLRSGLIQFEAKRGSQFWISSSLFDMYLSLTQGSTVGPRCQTAALALHACG